MALTLNPNFNWTRFGGNALQDIGVGLTQSPTIWGGLGAGARRNAEMQPLRAEAERIEAQEAERRQAIADQAALRAKYADFFTKAGKPEIAQAISDGITDPGQAYWEHITPKAPIKASEGDVFLDPNTLQPVGGVPTATKPTSAMQEYEFAKSQGYTGTFQQYETDMKKAGATQIDFNANQGNAAAYADRMAAADAIISDPKMEAAMMDLTKQGLNQTPFGIGNFLVGPEFQQAEQAKRDFINAILRRESGATIRDEEFQSANLQYFPQPGDTPEVLRQKAENRRIAIEGVQRAAGPNYQSPTLTPPGVVDYTTYFGGQ
jgi:hypothetical protein